MLALFYSHFFINPKYLSKLIFSVLIFSFSLFSDHLYPEIKKINEDFYVAKIKDRELFLVAERVGANNIPAWQQYAAIQDNDRITTLNAKRLKGYTNDGSRHFKKVLDNFGSLKNKNEVWVLFVTSDKNPEPGQSEVLESYYTETMEEFAFARKIAMFTTVTTSKNALITTHLGISASYEGIQANIRGISIDFNSFGAKVMLMRNPERKFHDQCS